MNCLLCQKLSQLIEKDSVDYFKNAKTGELHKEYKIEWSIDRVQESADLLAKLLFKLLREKYE